MELVDVAKWVQANVVSWDVADTKSACKADPLKEVDLACLVKSAHPRAACDDADKARKAEAECQAKRLPSSFSLEELLLAEQVLVGAPDDLVSRIICVAHVVEVGEVPLVDRSEPVSGHFIIYY